MIKAARKTEFRIEWKYHEYKENISVLCDNLKQKIRALGNRISRYNERVKTISKYNRKRPTGTWGIWSYVDKTTYDWNMPWIQEAEHRIPTAEMKEINIVGSDIKEGSNNWATPGCDSLHNYWWKHFNSVHKMLSTLLEGFLSDPTLLPSLFTQGQTFLILKGGDPEISENYHLTTCFPTVYKILTSIITKNLNKHLRANKLMAPEQWGGRLRIKGYKELLHNNKAGM